MVTGAYSMATSPAEFDATDLVLFETLQWIADQEKAFSLWGEPTLDREYRVAQMPVYFVRRDDKNAPTKAYLINFPSPPTGASKVSHAFSGLGTVCRYDDEMAELKADKDFEFALNVSGRPTFVMAYSPARMDRNPLKNTKIAYSRLDRWVDTFVHELFHHYQFHAPNSDWRSMAWGGLTQASYPLTTENVALSLLERHALLAGRGAGNEGKKLEVLRQVLAIRHTRTQLREAVGFKRPSSKTTSKASAAPNGVGQSFTTPESGLIRSIKVRVEVVQNGATRLELQKGDTSWPGCYVQDITLNRGENLISLDIPFQVEAGALYSFGLFPSSGTLSLRTCRESYAGGDSFFITRSRTQRSNPTSDLEFELTIDGPVPTVVAPVKAIPSKNTAEHTLNDADGPNFIDLMDRYQERNEGSATLVVNRLFELSGSTAYVQELREMLERSTHIPICKSREDLFRTFFSGGWYRTGATLLELVDGTTEPGWRATFPSGGNPIDVLERRIGPLSQNEIDRLVDEAKQTYHWNSILDQVASIPSNCLDRVP